MLNKKMFLKPKIALEGQPQGAKAGGGQERLTACPACRHALFASELRERFGVCPRCGRHMRIPAREFIRLLADAGSFAETNAGVAAADRLGFPQYPEKLAAARRESGESEAAVTGLCRIGGMPAAVFAMEAAFMMGSMSSAVGDKIAALFEEACARRLPVVGYTVSGGARVQEGLLSLVQMAKTSGAVKRHSDAGLLYIAILTDPTTGGVTASFAMEGDIILAEPGALIGFAGPRVIEQTMRQKLPPGFQRAEFLLQKGFVDRIAPRPEQRALIQTLLRLHGCGGEGAEA